MAVRYSKGNRSKPNLFTGLILKTQETLEMSTNPRFSVQNRLFFEGLGERFFARLAGGKR